ncbi:MAG: hypothetical protein LOY58_13425 [Gammaproteobacteria bacterium]|nr:hypothetical protein [Gammaproteobacteria bacterium]
MTATRPLAALFALLLALLSAAATAADRIEVVTLQNRSAEELMPLIRPMLDESEALSGTGYRLIVRATPQRQEEIRALIAQLDQAARQLRISIRRAAHEEIEREGIRGAVDIGAAGGEVEARGRAIVRSTRDKDGEGNYYEVTALEGTPAFIHTGEAFPVPSRSGHVVDGRIVIMEGIDYRELSSGFYALARTHDGEVTVDISPQREVLDPRGSGRIRSTALVTTVRGRLGEWLELGGTARQRTQEGGGLLRSTRSRDAAQQTLWLKVEVAE